jgi:hypothetical protein
LPERAACAIVSIAAISACAPLSCHTPPPPAAHSPPAGSAPAAPHDTILFAPRIEWFDDAGESFAQVDDLGAGLREGWKESIPKLLALQ